MSDNEARPAPSADSPGFKSLGVARHGDIEFELTVVCFGLVDEPEIGWVWLGSKKLGYLGGFREAGFDLTFRTHGGTPVDRALTWPQEADVKMFGQFRELWRAAYEGHESLGEFQLFGATYRAWRNMDVPTTVRFARDGIEIGKLTDVGSYPQLKLYREEWPKYRRNAMRFKLLDMLAAQKHSS
jgi:hypothetical protein